MLCKGEDVYSSRFGVLSYRSPPGRWRSAVSSFPLRMVERGNLQCLESVNLLPQLTAVPEEY